MFPWCTEYELEDLPDFAAIAEELAWAGRLARAYDQRLTFHPSHFVKLAAEGGELLGRSMKELEVHSRVRPLLCLLQTALSTVIAVIMRFAISSYACLFISDSSHLCAQLGATCWCCRLRCRATCRCRMLRLTSGLEILFMNSGTTDSPLMQCVLSWAQVFDLMGYPPSHENKINIHIGGVYGDKPSTLGRFAANFKKLSPACRARLTVENDDIPELVLHDGTCCPSPRPLASPWCALGLPYPCMALAGVHIAEGVYALLLLLPRMIIDGCAALLGKEVTEECANLQVFDFHHQKFCPGGDSCSVLIWPVTKNMLI